ncbi:hypothetical protein M5K25_010380 [Dendrobium thyrsiflorum]|uniref:Retrovirus-related Pol polyprotein from transposon TNT 1-94 n=1 Tax=Dendrobium thyrsiflorum TaxID=117978 RepID=A0ABD0V0F5_DENTH
MADQDSAASHPPNSSLSTSFSDFTVPAPLKFLISNLKNLVPTQLTVDTDAIWRLQLLQHFTANGFAGHLTGETPCPLDSSHPDFNLRRLVDRNLISALLSTISPPPPILPYMLSSPTAHDVWAILEKQPTSCSRVIQLKHELHQIQMRDRSMQQYLAQIKILVDNIAAAGSKIDTEDVILYILNGLPSSYNSFKAAICTSLNPIDLDVLYSLLCSEEIKLQTEHQKDSTPLSDTTALMATHSRGRHYSRSSKGPQHTNDRPICQICGKTWHTALNCWHRCNPKYAPTNTSQNRAQLSQLQPNSSSDWVLDSGASTHLTPDLTHLQQPAPYHGADSVSIANAWTICSFSTAAASSCATAAAILGRFLPWGTALTERCSMKWLSDGNGGVRAAMALTKKS